MLVEHAIPPFLGKGTGNYKIREEQGPIVTRRQYGSRTQQTLHQKYHGREWAADDNTQPHDGSFFLNCIVIENQGGTNTWQQQL